ncbi:MFS transporter [Nocardioides conyzicola]|uniref:MFS transporter n=1 Tax=Nocardioides conyzicola TaxID=1651781 RepID=A0ABP8WNS6_9ACTN
MSTALRVHDLDPAVRVAPRWRDSAYAPVAVAVVLSAALQTVWLRFMATSGGDIAAQDAWAEFARLHPGSAYDLAWYGGMHPVSYSAISPFVMAGIGVRTTMVLTSVVAAALLAWLVTHRMARGGSRLVVAGVGALALLGNAVSGRVTFALGTTVALAAVCVVTAWPSPRAGRSRLARGVLAATLAATATACSPVAGLFLGVVAAALWLRRRWAAAYALGVPAVAVVAASTLLFPFSGRQPMSWTSAVLPAALAVAVALLAPRGWREVRTGAGVYLVMVVLVWLVPTPIGSNVTRLGLLFGGVALVAVALSGRWRGSAVARRLGAPAAAALLATAIVTSLGWQVSIAGHDALRSRPPTALDTDLAPLVARLRAAGPVVGRVEVVPTRSHREAAALASYVPLVRGWNRQADVQRNPLFYGSGRVDATTYHHWLRRWAVQYVVLATTAAPDFGAGAEARLVGGGLPYLHVIWSDPTWTLYAVRRPASLVRPVATVTSFDADQLTVTTPAAGRYVVKVATSPWLSLVDADGRASGIGCLTDLDSERPTSTGRARTDDWVVLRAPAAGTYRIAAPYRLPRGSRCAA